MVFDGNIPMNRDAKNRDAKNRDAKRNRRQPPRLGRSQGDTGRPPERSPSPRRRGELGPVKLRPLRLEAIPQVQQRAGRGKPPRADVAQRSQRSALSLLQRLFGGKRGRPRAAEPRSARQPQPRSATPTNGQAVVVPYRRLGARPNGARAEATTLGPDWETQPRSGLNGKAGSRSRAIAPPGGSPGGSPADRRQQRLGWFQRKPRNRGLANPDAEARQTLHQPPATSPVRPPLNSPASNKPPLNKVTSLNERRRSRQAQVASEPQAAAPARPARPINPMLSPLLYGLRLLVIGIGIGVIAGTVLSSLDPNLRYTPNSSASPGTTETQTAESEIAAGLQLSQEMKALKAKLEALVSQNPGLTPGVFVVDLDTGGYVDINGSRKFAAASTIKLPLLMAFFQAVDEGKVSLGESLTMRPELIAKEAGEMQFQEPGTQFPALQTVTEMIRTSDNTATNMVIDRLGGAAQINQRFQAWGLTQTVLRNLLPDVQGTNTMSPRDLVMLLGRVNQGEILSLRSRDRLLSILRTTELNDLLPQGLGPGATIAHKTGNIGTAIGDIGLVDMPTGKRYLIMAMVERPRDATGAEELIRQISKETYVYLESMANKSEQQPALNPTNIAEGQGAATPPAAGTAQPPAQQQPAQQPVQQPTQPPQLAPSGGEPQTSQPVPANPQPASILR